MLSSSSTNVEAPPEGGVVFSSTPSTTLPVVKHKLILLGDQSVGKTSLISRFMYDTFSEQHQTTIGVDFFSKMIPLETHTVRLDIWDTAGQERFRALIPSYIRHSAAAVVVYDVTRRPSFLVGLAWIDEVRVARGPDVVIVLVGNKLDVADAAAREVGAGEAAQEAARRGATHVEVSARHGTHVRALFRGVIEALPGPRPGGEQDPAAGLSGEGASETGAMGMGRVPGGRGLVNLGRPSNAFLVTPSTMQAAGERVATPGQHSNGEGGGGGARNQCC